MAINECLLEVGEMLGRKLSSKEKEEIANHIDALTARFERRGSADVQGDVSKALAEEIRKKEVLAIVKKRTTIFNTAKKIQMERELNLTYGDKDFGKGIEAFLTGSISGRKGAGNSVGISIESAQGKARATLISRLAKEDLLPAIRKGDMDLEIRKAAWELSQETPNLTGLPKEAVSAAKIMLDVQEEMRVGLVNKGAWIDKLPGRIVKQTHDAVKLRKAGGLLLPVDDPAHEKAWIDFVKDKIDWDKTMPDVLPEDRAKKVSNLYNALASGVHETFQDASQALAAQGGFGSTASKWGHERVLHFVSPEAEHAYSLKFGKGTTLVENLVAEISAAARDTAIMDRMGPSAKANLDEVIQKKLVELKRKGGNLKAIDSIKKAVDNMDRVQWPVIDGSINIPGNKMVAEISATVRSVVSMSKLGSAVFSGIADIAAYASTLQYSGKSFFQAWGDVASNLVSRFFEKTSVSEQEIAGHFGLFVDVMNHHPALFDPNTPGKIARLQGEYYKLNLLEPWSKKIKLAASSSVSMEHAAMAGKSYAELPERMQKFMKRYGIESAEWETIRKGKVHVDEKGRSFLTPDSIDASTAAGSELQTKYRNLFFDVAAMASTEPGLHERAFMLQGTRPGTAIGEINRHFGMFKSFVYSVSRKHGGRFVMGYGDDLSFTNALKTMFTGKGESGQLAALSQFMATSTMLGYVAMTMKDLVKGRTPRDITENPGKVMTAAMLQGGALGIYGDFLFGETNRFGGGFIPTLLGPTAGVVDDLYKLRGEMANAATGEKSHLAASSLRFVLNNTPGYNLFYTRMVLDQMFVYNLQEMMNPGYLRRMESRLKEKGQTMISGDALGFEFNPAQRIPYGGGF